MDVPLGPYGGQRRFLQTKTLQQGYTLQAHQAIPSLSKSLDEHSFFFLRHLEDR